MTNKFCHFVTRRHGKTPICPPCRDMTTTIYCVCHTAAIYIVVTVRRRQPIYYVYSCRAVRRHVRTVGHRPKGRRCPLPAHNVTKRFLKRGLLICKVFEFIDAIRNLSEEEHQLLIKLMKKFLAEEELNKSYEQWNKSLE